MKINTILIPIIGFSIVGVTLYEQDNVTQNHLIQKTAEVKVDSHLVSKQTNKIEPAGQWKLSIDSPEQTQHLPEEVLVKHIQMQPNAFEHLIHGEKINIYIPQEQHDYIGTVEKSHLQFGGLVKVSTGSIENGNQFSSFTVTKGPELTLVMVATGEKIYQVEINNKTGAGTVIDDQSLDFFRQHDDSQVTPPEGIS